MKSCCSQFTIRITVCMLMMFVIMALCSPYSSEFTVNKKFSETGRRTVIFNGSNPNSQFYYYISLEGPTYNCFSAISIADLEMQVANKMDISVQFVSCLSYNRNGYYNYTQYSSWWNEKYNRMSVAIKTTQPTLIKKLVISYFVCRKEYAGSYFDYKSLSVKGYIYKNVWFSQIQLYQYSGHYDNRALIFLNGFRAMSNDTSLTYSMYIAQQIKFVNQFGTKLVQVYLRSNSQIPTYIESIAFTVYYTWYRYKISVDIYSGSISSTNTNSLEYLSNEHTMESFNTFIGLTSFHISNQQTFSIFSSILGQNTISVTSNNFFKEISVSYIILYSKWCSHNTPHYYQSQYSQTCFKQCPLCTYKGYCLYKDDVKGDYNDDQFICHGQYLSCQRDNNYIDCIKSVNPSQIVSSSSFKQSIFFASLITFVLLFVIIRTCIVQKKKMSQANLLKSKSALWIQSPEKQGTQKQLKREEQLKQQQFSEGRNDLITQ